MRHLVTISLVFFSLTHLAKAERVEDLRYLSDRYCNKQQIGTEIVSLGTAQQDHDRNPFFLSYNDLSTIGTLPETEVAKYIAPNHFMASSATREQPRNNSP